MVSKDSYFQKRAYYSWKISERRREIKRQAVEYKGGKCEWCGYDKCIDALTFHHKDPIKKDFGISGGNTKKWDRIKPELDKCIMLCHNCHAEEHFRINSAKAKEKELRVRKIVKERSPGERVTIQCGGCHKKIDVLVCRLRYGKAYCSSECYQKHRDKIEWPNDDELRRLVWENPLTQLSSKLGVSDNAVKKRCRSKGIQTPPQGYWARKEHRKRLNRTGV